MASFLQARHCGGRWLVRIEDIDPPREVSGSASAILRDLSQIGLTHDGPVLYQSQRTRAYRAAIDRLLHRGSAYWCGCSRSDLPASGVYPGTCRRGLKPGKSPRTVRLRVNNTRIGFTDLIQGPITENLEETVGDFVIQRADGLPAYQLAVVVDDAHQGVTEVVRGTDLLDSTGRQIHLQQCLGLSTPAYAHHPLATLEDGHKLGKRFGSLPVARMDAIAVVKRALEFLGQSSPSGEKPEEILLFALRQWRLSSVPPVANIPAPKFAQPE